jgi:hypothetical protein
MGDPSTASSDEVSAAGWLAIVAAFLVVPLVLLVAGRDPGWWQLAAARGQNAVTRGCRPTG